MPYADPEKKREADRRSFQKRYHASKEFRILEAIRKAEWLQTPEGKASNAANQARIWRKKKRAKKAKPKTQ